MTGVQVGGSAMIVAFTFVLWPIVGRYANASGAWVGGLVMFFTFVVIVGMALTRSELVEIPNVRSLGILIFAGLMNGIGVYIYAQMTSQGQTSAGLFVVLVAIFMVMIAPILSYFMNGEDMTIKQIMGIACGALTVYLLQS